MSRMTKASHLIQNPDPDGGEPKDLDSQMNHDPMPSRNSSVKQRKTPVNKHMQSLQAFLMTHMDNLAALQTAISSGTEMHAKRSIGESPKIIFCYFPPMRTKWKSPTPGHHRTKPTAVSNMVYLSNVAPSLWS